jgi:hypothetical protein
MVVREALGAGREDWRVGAGVREGEVGGERAPVEEEEVEEKACARFAGRV